MHYNYVRVHQTLRTTPAVAAGLASRPWSLAELVAAALAEVEHDPEPDEDGPNGVDVESEDGEARDSTHVEGGGLTVDSLARIGALAVNDNGAAPQHRLC
jgi:hypothetical protein